MTKSERALELREKGLTPEQISERIGCTRNNVSAMINHARKKRERMKADVGSDLEST